MGNEKNKLDIVKEILERSKSEKKSISELCKEYGIDRTTFYRNLKKLESGKIQEKQKTSETEKQVFSKSKKVKRTFELLEEVEKAIRIEAALQGKKIVDFVNEALWQAVSEQAKKVVKGQ